MSPGEPAEKPKGELHFLPNHRFTPETLGAWLERRIQEGDIEWIAICYEGRNGARVAMAKGSNSTLAYAALLLQGAAMEDGLVLGPERLDYDCRPGEGEDGTKEVEKGELEGAEQREGERDPPAR